MPRPTRPRLTFANVTSALAVFVTLGGTSYAVATIDGRDVEKRSVPGDRLVKDGVTGQEAREASLATVPGASRVGGVPASRTIAGGALLPLDANDRFPAAVLPAGADRAAEHTRIDFRADTGTESRNIFENEDFRITTYCDPKDGPSLTLRPKTDHGAWSQTATGLDDNNVKFAAYNERSDTSVVQPTLLNFFAPLPEDRGTVIYMSPGGARVTVLDYQTNFSYAGHDCTVTGTATTV